MNVNEVVEKMKETKTNMRRPSTLALVNEVKNMADAHTVRKAAIAYHTAEYRCSSVPSDTMSWIDSALGLEVAEVESCKSGQFNPNW